MLPNRKPASPIEHHKSESTGKARSPVKTGSATRQSAKEREKEAREKSRQVKLINKFSIEKKSRP
jgi:hypothetical protein